MNKQWSTLTQIKHKLQKQWDKGVWLQTQSEQQFPLRISLKAPNSAQLIQQFSQAQQWIRDITANQKYPVEYKTLNHRKLGQNQIPCAVVIPTLDHLLQLLQKQQDYQHFNKLSQQLLSEFPELQDWLNQYPFQALKYSENWNALMHITSWIKQNPLPNIYTRQIPLPEIDTKIIEQHKALLTQWWNILLPAQVINESYHGLAYFEQRFGFRTKPILIRFRLLDKHQYIQGLSDLSVSVDEFATLKLNINRVFVVENDINGLVFPHVTNALVIFGRGYGFEQWKKIHWLKGKQLYYWGDLDTHGFAILNQFRSYFSKTRSFLMEEAVLMAHKRHWVTEKKQVQHDLPLLNEQETRVFNLLRDNELKNNLRLEQEYIHLKYLNDFLAHL